MKPQITEQTGCFFGVVIYLRELIEQEVSRGILMKTIILTKDETCMIRIDLENELEKYNNYYKPDERTDLNVWLLKTLI